MITTNRITLTREFSYEEDKEDDLIKELVLQVRKVIGPFAAPKKVYVVSDLPKTRSGKVCCNHLSQRTQID